MACHFPSSSSNTLSLCSPSKSKFKKTSICPISTLHSNVVSSLHCLPNASMSLNSWGISKFFFYLMLLTTSSLQHYVLLLPRHLTVLLLLLLLHIPYLVFSDISPSILQALNSVVLSKTLYVTPAVISPYQNLSVPSALIATSAIYTPIFISRQTLLCSLDQCAYLLACISTLMSQ